LPVFPREYAQLFVAMLSPFAPFICESIWRDVLKNKKSVLAANWPVYSKKFTIRENVEIAVQINGKTRGTVKVLKQLSKEEILKIIEADKKLGVYIRNKGIKRVIFVPDRIINVLL